MSKFLEVAVVASIGVTACVTGARAGGDAAAGKAAFQQCAVCHRVGPGAKNAIGPVLDGVVGRKAGTYEGYSYSPAMKKKGEEGFTWTPDKLDAFLTNPMKDVPGTKMGFAGLHSDKDRQNVIAYLESLSKSGDSTSAARAAGDAKKQAAEAGKAEEPTPAAGETAQETGDAKGKVVPVSHAIPQHGVYHLGRRALPAEISAWNVDIRPDGTGLPAGHGTARQGEALFNKNCASCHGDFGEGVGRWPVLAGGDGSLTKDRPEKTVGSYWPYLSTVYDYVRRAMPFGNAHSLSNDDYYALTAYILYLNYVVKDEDFDLSNKNFASVHLPNEHGFIMDNRLDEPQYAKKAASPCMKDCKGGPAKITMEAKVLNVTPDAKKGPEAGHGIE